MKSIIISLLFLFSFNLHAQDTNHSSMNLKELLQEISLKAIQLGHLTYSTDQLAAKWIGHEPATEEEINDLEKRLGISLPADFVEFLRLTNGFEATSSVEPTFCTLDKIDYLKNVDAELVEIWNMYGNDEIGNLLQTAIKVGGFDEEQYFFLIPPNKKNPHWQYWKFATWIPGEEVYTSLKAYFGDVENMLDMFLKEK